MIIEANIMRYEITFHQVREVEEDERRLGMKLSGWA